MTPDDRIAELEDAVVALGRIAGRDGTWARIGIMYSHLVGDVELFQSWARSVQEQRAAT